MKRFFLLLLLVMMQTAHAQSVTYDEEPLWTDQVGEGGFTATVTFYTPEPELATGTAVVICPGGGYSMLALGHEGVEIAEWLNSLGITAVILKYHHMSATTGMSRLHPLPLNQVQRAIRLVRSRAEELHIDPQKIGVLGFSAGGHLASTAATHSTPGDPGHEDPIEWLSSRPDFAVLLYPVITFQEPYLHAGSMHNLLGDDPSEEMRKALSNELQVTANTPPTFLAHTDEDTAVPAENSLLFYQALRNAGVPAELHLFREGKHGLGMQGDLPFAQWPLLCEQWLKGMGFL